MRRLLLALLALALPLGLTLAASPAHAIEWSPKTCVEHPDKSYTTCLRFYTTVWGSTYSVHYVETCLSGNGATGPLVRNARDNRVVIRTTNNAYIRQVYISGTIDRGDCRVTEIQPGAWPSGAGNMEGVWTGHVNVTFPGFDDDFSMCRQVVSGFFCI